MATIISKEPKVAPPKNRSRYCFGDYELARIKVPEHVAAYIESRREELLHCKARNVYELLKEKLRFAPNYTESQRLQYLSDFFWLLSTETPIELGRVGEEECVPTDLWERENSAFGFEKVQPCVVLSVRCRVTCQQWRHIRRMIDIVEGKMRSFKQDFYLHDMLRFSRLLGKCPLMWIVGRSHTFNEYHDAEHDAGVYMADGMEEHRENYLRHDDTWVGSALRVACGKEDDYYYHDGKELRKVSREEFQSIHDRYVESVREKIRERIKELKAA